METLDIIVLFIAIMYVDYYIYLKTRDWFKELFYVVKNYKKFRVTDGQVASNRHTMNREWLRNIDTEVARVRNIAESVQPELHMDVHTRSPYMKCVMIGVERGRDTVQVFSLEAKGFDELLHHARHVRVNERANMGRVDSFPELKAIIEKEVW